MPHVRARSFSLLFLTAMFLIASMGGAGGVPGRVPPPPRWKAVSQIPHPEADTPRTLAAAYYSLKSRLSASLLLSNQGPHPMEVRIRLFSLAGEPFDLDPVTLGGNEVRTFHLRDFVPAGPDFQEGSLEVRFNGKYLELGAVLSLVDAARSLIFDEELTEPASALVSSRLAGVWWSPAPTAALRLVLSNATGAPLSATVRVDGTTPGQKAPVKVALGPHETRVLGLAKLLGRPVHATPGTGGVSIVHTAPKGGLLARVLIAEPALGYSDTADLSDPGQARSPRLNGTGLRVGRIAGSPLTQAAVVYNANEKSVALEGRIPYTTAEGQEGFIPLPSLRLAPREVREIDLAAALNRSGIERISTAGLEFEHDGPSGTVVIKALAVSASGTQVFRVPLVDAILASSTGIYPWSLADGLSAIVYIKNVTSKPQNYTMSLDFDGGPYVFGLKTVPARQTVAIDLRALRDGQVPDVYGNTIPLNVTGGKANWSMNGPEQHSLVGRLEQVDLAKGMSFTAACGACCPNSTVDAYIDPFIVTGFPGATTQFTLYGQEVNCYGSGLPWFPANGYFTSTNTSVATVTTSGFASAVAPGSTLIQSTFNGASYYNCAREAGNDEYCCDSTPVVIPCESECHVQPTVRIVFDGSGVPLKNGNPPPNSWPSYVNSVTMKAESDFLGGTYEWSTTSNKVTLSNTTSETVTVTSVSESAAENDVVIKVKFTIEGESATAEKAITVQKPSGLKFVSYGAANNAPESCPTGKMGRVKDIKWQLTDQWNHDIRFAIPGSDELPTNSGENGCGLTLTGTPPSEQAYTTSSGIWEHHYHFCTDRCPCTTKGVQKYFFNGFPVDLPFTFTCDGITVAGKKQ